MKKSSQRLDHNFSVNVKLPPKPIAPNVAMTDEKEMFKTIKVAKVKIPPVSDQKGSDLGKENFIQSVQVVDDTATPVAKTKPVPNDEAVAKPIELALINAAKNVIKKREHVAAEKSVKPAVKVQAQTMKKPKVTVSVPTKANGSYPVNKKGIYAVQLASFSKLSNAQALVSKLHSKGYKANYVKTSTKRGVIYKVYAGHSPVKSDVIKLRTQLASTVQLNGFVVNTGVS